MIAPALSISGPVTIGCLVILGIFVYPWLLARGARGIAAIAFGTIALTALYAYFGRATEPAALRYAMALLWALAPLLAALIAVRVQRPD